MSNSTDYSAATAVVLVSVLLCAYYTLGRHSFVIEITEKVDVNRLRAAKSEQISFFWMKAPVTCGRISLESSSTAFMFRQATVRGVQAFYWT